MQLFIIHLSPDDVAPETLQFVQYLNSEATGHGIAVWFAARHGHILVYGNIRRLARSNTLGAWAVRRAIRTGYSLYQLAPGDSVLRRTNSLYRSERRRQEKSRPPVKEYRFPRQHGQRRPSDRSALATLVKITNEKFYQLICAISVVERDREEIYPADFSKALIPLPQRTNWPADRLKRWRRQGRLLCGVSSNALLGRDSLGLRDYSEPARLLFRGGRYGLVSRQKAASAVRAIETRLALYAWQRLTPSKTQYVLKRDGRLYKNSCWWSKKEKRCLFDKAWASSGKKLSWAADGHISTRLDPADPVAVEKREAQQNRREGGRVIYLGKPAERHANLERTRAAYNERYESYLNSTGLGKRLRRSLNIPREMIEVRNNMIANLENDFGRDEATVA